VTVKYPDVISANETNGSTLAVLLRDYCSVCGSRKVGSGGNLIGVEHTGSMCIDLLRNASYTIQAGARILGVPTKLCFESTSNWPRFGGGVAMPK